MTVARHFRISKWLGADTTKKMKHPEYKIPAKLAEEILEVLQGASTDETGEYNNNDNIKVLEAFQDEIRKQDEAPNVEVSDAAAKPKEAL